MFPGSKGILTFIIINVQVIGGGEDGDEGREACRLALSVHAVPAERKCRSGRTSVKFIEKQENVHSCQSTYQA